MKLSLRVVYDDNDNWTLTDMDNGEVWELGDTPSGTVATVDLEIELPDVTPPTCKIRVPGDAIAEPRPQITVQKFD